MTEPEETNPSSPHVTSTKSKRLRVLWGFTFLVLLLGLLAYGYWYFYLRFYESTDNAYANGHLTPINSIVSGPVVAFFADDTDLVKQGQLLVQIDPTNYQIAYQAELAKLASIVLQVRQLYANRVAAGNTLPENHPLIEEQKSKTRIAFYHLQHCAVYAPITGYVAQRAVSVGQWTLPTTSLMTVIPAEEMWVDANFKETELSPIRIGQPAEIWFDLYGSKVKFEGKVIGIAMGTGSVFSLIPPQNATGNWIKIVQRLPVRISLDKEKIKEYPLRIGISAEVRVDISNQDLPRLALVPHLKSVAYTPIFEINLEEVNQAMNAIIQENLQEDKNR